MRTPSINVPPVPRQRQTVRLASFAIAMVASLAAAAQTLSPDNQRYSDEITALGIAHGVSTVAGIVTPPPADKIPEFEEYGINIGLKFMPAVLEEPPTLVLTPNFGDCEYRYPATDHPLFPVTDYENMYGINVQPVADWGLLDDAGPGTGDDTPPVFFHYNTGAWLTIRRNFVDLEEGIPETELGQPRQEILFSNTNDRHDIISGDYATPLHESFPVGTTTLTWEAENKLDGLFDVLLDPVLFFAEMKHAAKQAAAAKKAKRFARVWDDAAIKWAKSLEFSLGRNITQGVVKKLALFGVELGVDAVDASITSIPTGVMNKRRQLVRVLDEHPPEVTITQQPGPFEATTLGGELARKHFGELRELVETSDTCGRRVRLDPQPRGPRYWPIGKTSTMTWCGRDPGPRSATGGFNESCADITIDVEDTLPPLIVPPPAVNMVTSTEQGLDIGRPGIFDVADPDVMVTNDAPAVFPVGRTPVTWTATDSSGNSSTATQWVSLKESNDPPVAIEPATVEAVSFEETRIELAAEDDDSLDGRFDQLGFRVSDTPDHGFFVAPLFPFFIEDHRTHRINPDGTYESFTNDERLRCENGETTPDTPTPIDIIIDPQYISVNDDGEVYVLDKYHECSTGSQTFNIYFRFAKFAPDENGALEFETQYHLGSSSPTDRERHMFIDHERRLWFVPPTGGNAIVVLDEDLNQVRRISFDELTEINDSTGAVQPAFHDASNQRVQSMVVDRNDVLYATDGKKILAYDLETVIPAGDDYSRDRYAPVYTVARAGSDPGAEPWASYTSLTSGGYLSLAVDSEGNVYASDPHNDRVWKFQAAKLSPDRETLMQAPEVVGWIGACDANLDPEVLACDVDLGRSFGFSCQDDLCGATQTEGGDQGQFDDNFGIAMSPDDVLYVSDVGNNRVQRFTTDGFFAGEAVSECGGGCFVLGDFGRVRNISVNSNFFYLLDIGENLTHVFETTPITDIDDQTMTREQSAFVTYQSNNNFRGTDSFSFFAYDGLETSNEATVTIDVARNFRPPIATPRLSFETDEDAPVEFELTGLDPDEDTLEFDVSTPPEHGIVTMAGSGFVYEPDPDYYGPDSFEFVASDAPTSVPALESAPEVVTLDVKPVNDQPVIELEVEQEAPVGYMTQLELFVSDADPDDRRSFAIDWGDGTSTASDSEDAVIANAPGTSRVVANHVYESAATRELTVCASDADSDAVFTCDWPDVTARASALVDVVPMVDLVMDVEDSLPKTEDPVVDGLMISAPLLDGGDEVTYTIDVLNAPPSDESDPVATNVGLVIDVPAEMEFRNVIADAGSCPRSGSRITCALGDLPANGARQVQLTLAGKGALLADEIVTINPEVQADQPDPGVENNVASLQTTLAYNDALDADGDGVVNRDDAFPGDPSESVDTDGDGAGNNADRDDDGDVLPDTWEQRYGTDPLDAADAADDGDGDGLTNVEEFERGSRPDTTDSDADSVADGSDNCAARWNRRQFDSDGNSRGDVCDAGAFAHAAPLPDLNGNGADDVAVMRVANGNPTVYVKDGDTNLSIATFATSASTPLALLAAGDVDDTSRAATLIVDNDAGTVRAWLHEAASGNALASYDIAGPGAHAVDAVLAGEAGTTELATLLVTADGASEVHAVAAADGGAATVTPFFTADHRPLALAATDDAFAVLAMAPNGAAVVEIREPGADAARETVVVSGDFLDADLDGRGDRLVVAVHETGGGAATVLRADGEVEAAFGLGAADEVPVAIRILGGEAVGTIIADGSGALRLEHFALADGSEAAAPIPVADGLAPRGLYLAGTGIDTAIAGVTVSDDTGDIFVEQYETESGTTLERVSATSDSPPPPPPPPPPGDSGGSGGGGAVHWTLLAALLVALARIRHRSLDPPLTPRRSAT